MSDERRLGDAKRGQQRVRVQGELLKRILVSFRLGGLAKPNLIRRDDAVTRIRQGDDGRAPCGCAKVLAVHEDHCASIGLCGRTSMKAMCSAWRWDGKLNCCTG